MEKSDRSSSRNPPRKYDASRRQVQARERRRRIVDSATRLFLDQGFGATSIKQIAEAADVAVPTVYAAFDSKAGILGHAVNVAIVGDDEQVALSERPLATAIAAEADMATRAAMS